MPAKADGLTKAQSQRVVNVGERVAKKIKGTFGNTLESFSAIEPEDTSELLPFDAEQGAAFEVVSNGVVYTFIIAAARAED